ncbi:MAG: type II toxin-antitoxin system PemK/MazF family toxin [Patescibacteria group bacterium]
MKKDFDKWNGVKTKTNQANDRVFFHEREVWWCRIGVNVGYEQDGKGDNFARPIIIFKKFNNEVCWVIPLSTKIKKGKFYIPIELGDKTERVVIISQLRLIDAKRLYQKISILGGENYKKIQNAVISLCQ